MHLIYRQCKLYANLFCNVFGLFVFLYLFISPALAEPVSLEQIIQQAVERSLELKIATVDVALAKNDVKAARVDYFPVIRGNLNTEYQHSLQSQPSQVTTVNNMVLPIGTRYQNSIGLNLNHTLLDFGTRRYKLSGAKQGVQAKALESERLKRELQLKLIDLYTDALISYKSKKAHEALFQLAQQQYMAKRRLQAAGQLSTIPVAEEAIQMAQYLDRMQGFQDQLIQKLQEITYYTQERYEPQTLELTDLVADTTQPTFSITVTHSPDARIYDTLIAQKQAEISALKRQKLPTLSLYSYYNLYGFDPESWHKSVTNLSQRTVTVGLSVSLPIFDGFKNKTAVERAELEKEKLQLQKADRLAKLQNQVEIYQQQATGYGVELKTRAVILNKTQDKLTMLNRLTEQKVVDATQAIQEHMSRIQKQLDVEKSLIQQMATLKKLNVLAEGT